MWTAIVSCFSGIFKFLGKALPYLLAYKAGSDATKKKEEEKALEDITKAKKVEDDLKKSTTFREEVRKRFTRNDL